MSSATSSCSCSTSSSGQIERSLWFNPCDFTHMAVWIVYMFECEVKIAYLAHRKSKQKTQDRPTSFIGYIRNKYSTRQQLQPLVERTIVDNFLVGDKFDPETYKNKKNYLMSRCMDRLSQQLDMHEFLLQYSWYFDNKENQSFKIITEVCRELHNEYTEWLENKPLLDFVEKQQLDIQRRIDKRKRKKLKKSKNKLQEKGKIIKQQQAIEDQLVPQETHAHKTQENHQVAIPYADDQEQQKKAQSHPISEAEVQEYSEVDKPGPSQHPEGTKQAHANRKTIKQRINQYYECYTRQLIESASVYEKYKKIVYRVIHNFLTHELSKHKWSLQVYGSASAGFALQHSDIDLLLLVPSEEVTLSYLCHMMKQQKWAFDCKVIQAQVPIITVDVNLCSSEVAMAELNPKQQKKLQNEFFSVDLTISRQEEPHSGIENTQQLRKIYEQYPRIRNICLLFKQYLRLRNLNKPYRGGINSYVLIITIHAILYRRNLLSGKEENNSDYCRQIRQISEFFEHSFIPFETVIFWKKNHQLKPDPSLHLNVGNPYTAKLVKTSAFQIDKIIEQFRKLRDFQEEVQEKLLAMNLNEKKNMKSLFTQHFKAFLAEPGP